MPGIELDDLIVLLLGTPTKNRALKGRIEGITRLEKLIFLIEQETSIPKILTEDTNFKPCNFGPFSDKVYKTVDYLSSYGLIEDTGSISNSRDESWEQVNVIDDEFNDPYATRNFTLTEKGLRYYEVLIDELRNEMDYIEELSELKETFGLLKLRQLVRYVYNQYPEMTEQSIIRSSILADV